MRQVDSRIEGFSLRFGVINRCVEIRFIVKCWLTLARNW